MPRIRTIKPEFCQSETVGKLSRDARLLFIQLWTIADDEGRARASSRMLASLLYPYDDDAPRFIDGWLDELEKRECIRQYVVDGSHFLYIPNWLKHQKIDHPTPSKLPPFVESSTNPRESSRLILDLGPRTLDQETSSLRSDVSAPSAEKTKKASKTASRLPDDFVPDESEAIRIGLTPQQASTEAANFRDYWTAKATNATKRDWPATWRVWCRKATTSPSRFNGNGNGSSKNGNGHNTASSAILRSIARVVEKRAGMGGGEANFDGQPPGDRSRDENDQGSYLDLEPEPVMRGG